MAVTSDETHTAILYQTFGLTSHSSCRVHSSNENLFSWPI